MAVLPAVQAPSGLTGELGLGRPVVAAGGQRGRRRKDGNEKGVGRVRT